jgi:hypothetical protein
MGEEADTDEAIIQRELDEDDVDAERALVVLVGTLVTRHMDCELRKLGLREPWPGADRTNALVAAMDALFQYSRADEQTFGAQPHPELPADDAVNVRRMLMRVLTQCQFLAERQAGIAGDDDDDKPPPMMRLVTD